MTNRRILLCSAAINSYVLLLCTLLKLHGYYYCCLLASFLLLPVSFFFTSRLCNLTPNMLPWCMITYVPFMPRILSLSCRISLPMCPLLSAPSFFVCRTVCTRVYPQIAPILQQQLLCRMLKLHGCFLPLFLGLLPTRYRVAFPSRSCNLSYCPAL